MPDRLATSDAYPTPDALEKAHEQAVQEKAYAAERNVNLIRAAVIVFNSLVYALLMDPAGTIPALAWSVIVAANAYWVLVWLFEPYRRIDALMTSYFTSLTDAFLITLWVWGTGGFQSPFYLLWYLSIVAIAFRYGFRETMAAAAFYVACYVALLAGIGELTGNGTDTVVRSAYILLVGGMGGLLSREASQQTEEKVRMRNLMEEARAAEARFRRLLTSAPDAIVITNAEGRIIVANKQAETLTGRAREGLLGLELNRVLPGIADQLGLGTHQQANLEEIALDHPIEGYARREDGRRVPVEASIAPMKTREGELVSCIIRDVTDRKRAELELEQRNRELARSNEELQQFAYVASHDLQEPLRMVSSYVQLLERRYKDQLDDDAKEFIGYATKGVDRMHNLIRDLLAFSRAGSRDQDPEPVDTREVVEEVLATLEGPIQETRVQLNIGDLPTVWADRSQVAQVFQNLVSNAIKFRGEDDPAVWIDAEREEGSWVFSVEDNGIGIPDEYQHKIFILFQRLHDQEEYPGTGIGLAICKKIIENHGGRIWFESPPEGSKTGTGFYFSLPPLEARERGSFLEGATNQAPAAPRTRLDAPTIADENPGQA